MPATDEWNVSASAFMIVILPMRVNFHFVHCLQTPSTFLIISFEFKSQKLYISVENVLHA